MSHRQSEAVWYEPYIATLRGYQDFRKEMKSWRNLTLEKDLDELAGPGLLCLREEKR